MLSQFKYTATRGVPWERLIMVKDRTTHRTVRITDAWATLQVSATVKRDISVSITSEGGIMLTMTADEVWDLPVGELSFDVVGVVQRRSALAGGGWTSITTPVASGSITVENPVSISSLRGSRTMEIKFKRGTDLRETVLWTDDNGDVVTLSNAVLQAKDSNNNTVIDLRWYSAPLSEVQIQALPNAQRGYLAPYEGQTMEIHISNMNPVSAGEYPFDILAQETNGGDWGYIAGGYMIVEATVSEVP